MSRPVTALLGPTNTGKTWLAVERMLSHPSGMVGFPLRLLARREPQADEKEQHPEPPQHRWGSHGSILYGKEVGESINRGQKTARLGH